MEPKWLTWAKEIQALAQAGLAYSQDIYDQERFQRLREISNEIVSSHTDIPFVKLTDLFTNETGYQTPKVDIRAVVLEKGELLLVQEKSDGKWALPGGWGDVGLSPGEVAAKETLEEAGLKVKPVRMLAVYDTIQHDHPPMPYHVYKFFVQCELQDGKPTGGVETSHAAFFAENQLPPLSISRNTQKQIFQLFQDATDPNAPCRFD
ncbi:NUDIX domain-containing protein [Sediminibacillus dalangtanensis]|uniref:NUDIX domain-containing protein n=1 Tax=Sediminibacillus dalangtanensis TaxID=2729421 RepID=A0ABX7VSK5_9BACI|nr:NUDIX hydrolase [Sediminibacillus dalangtanensis]QTM98580.1 NUDIX domain-containing protein [Sediminibacillus dalangtanensis]